MPVIECIDLTKTYSRRVTALRNLTLNINEGTSFGLLGENGTGKSTLVRIIMGFIYPTSGSIRVLGETHVSRAHPRIGYVHERPIFETRFLVQLDFCLIPSSLPYCPSFSTVLLLHVCCRLSSCCDALLYSILIRVPISSLNISQ